MALSKSTKEQPIRGSSSTKEFSQTLPEEKKKKLPSSLDEADGDKRSPKLVQFLENAIRETIDKEKKKFKSVLGYAK